MKAEDGIRQSRHTTAGADTALLDGDSSAFLASFFVHLCVIISLGLAPMSVKRDDMMLVVNSGPMEEKVELTLPEAFSFSDQPTAEIGSNSVQGELAALSMAPVISDVSAVPNHLEAVPIDNGRIEINNLLQTATGQHYAENLAVKGAAGDGATGAVGAIDRITHEILLSLEERKTLVVWLFDGTASLIPQRKAIRDRFSKIYQELGIVEAAGNDAFVKHEMKPLVSAVVGFGNSVKFITDKPTDNLTELKRAVAEIPSDDSGTENVFTAIFEVAKRYASYRYTTAEKPNPERNVMIVVFTDEAGSDANRSEDTIKMCRRLAMPVYVIGVPAPFGRKETELKWVDPDPKYDQTPRRGIVEQGPETFLPERIRLNFVHFKQGKQGEEPIQDDEPIDSGFGPYALTRLCFETGGIYFAVHPNRDVQHAVSWGDTAAYSAHLKYFFDPEIMRNYRPDYVSTNEYLKRVKQNKARQALVEAAASSLQLGALDNPRLKFVKSDEAEFSRALSTAQQAAALLEPKINALYQMLQQGEADREKETVMRWQAGYDLAMGRTLAAKVRTEGYNAMLAAAKRGLKPSDPKNNTWELKASDEINVGSNYVKLAERARLYLNRVVNDHPRTPWAMLAQQELKIPMGWRWKDEFTDLTPKPASKAANNNAKAAPRNEQKTMLQKPETRPLPKL